MNDLITYAFSFIGTPYRWGGENPISGFDCSGLVQELLRSVGLDPVGDQSAQALYDHFKKSGDLKMSGSEGSLCFFGKSPEQITHVAFMIDSFRMIEAGGGGHLTMTREDAASMNAFVRMRPVSSRKDLVAIVMPRYPFVL